MTTTPQKKSPPPQPLAGEGTEGLTRKSSPRRLARNDAERRLATKMVAPSLTIMALVAAFPIGYALWLSLNQYSLMQAGLSRFVGLQNYIDAVANATWWAAFGQTLTFTVISVSLEIMLGTAIAVLLNQAFRGRGMLRAVMLVPYAVLTVVSAITWRTMFEPSMGLVTNVLGALGLPGGDLVWLGESGYAMAVVILADVWKTAPFVALLVLAGLQVIPSDIYEAAQLDGATKRQIFFTITLPLLKPAIALAAIFRTLDALRVFDLPFVLTRGANGTETMSMLAYRELRENRLIGEGSAYSIMTFIAVMLVALVYIRFAGGNIRDVAKEKA